MGNAKEFPVNDRSILFLAVNASYSHTNLAGGYLGAVADAEGWRWQTLETLDGADLPELLGMLCRYRPTVLAATFYLFNRQRLLTIVRRYKSLYPACIVIGGGPEFDGDNRRFLAVEPAIEVVVRGEGELAFRDWLRHIDARSHWRRIPGLCFRDGNNSYHDGGRAVSVDNLDDLPSPYRFLPDISRKPFAQLETTRGCTNRCVFCREGSHDILRRFSLSRVRQSLQTLREIGIREVRLLDRTFNEPAARARQLLSMLIEEFSDLRFHLEIDPGRLTRTFMDTLARAPAGQLKLEAGIQTFHPDAWRRMRRGTSPRRALNGLRALSAMPNLAVHADLIAGLPGANRASLRADIDTVIAAGPSELQLEILKVLPGTPLRDMAAAAGLVYAPDPPYEVLCSRDMLPADLADAAVWSRAIDWFYNTPSLRATTRIATQRWPDFWERAAAVVQQHHGGRPALRNRFLWLADLVAGAPELVDALRFEWMRIGLGERSGFITPRPWRGPVPAAAVRIAGEPSTANPRSVRRVQVRLDHDYLFVYDIGNDGRRRSMVYRLPDDHGSKSVNQNTATL